MWIRACIATVPSITLTPEPFVDGCRGIHSGKPILHSGWLTGSLDPSHPWSFIRKVPTVPIVHSSPAKQRMWGLENSVGILSQPFEQVVGEGSAHQVRRPNWGLSVGESYHHQPSHTTRPSRCVASDKPKSSKTSSPSTNMIKPFGRYADGN